MSARHHDGREAIAFQLAAALARYEDEVGALTASWPDQERYEGVSARVDEIRLYAGELPEVSVGWIAVLISHAELVHALWQGGDQARQSEAVRELVREHVDCIAALRRKALALVAQARGG
jgi:hypothetical protein